VKNHGVFSQNVLIFANCQIGFSEFLTMLSVKLGIQINESNANTKVIVPNEKIMTLDELLPVRWQ